MLGAGKEADEGNAEAGEATNALDSSAEALLKGLLWERAAGCWEAALELNGLGKFAVVWEPDAASTPGELAGVALDEGLLPNRALYCGGPPGGAATAGGSEKQLSRCDTAAYRSWWLEPPPPPRGFVRPTLPACCWDREWGRGCWWGWLRPPKSTLSDLGKALNGPVAPEADAVRPRVKCFLKELLATRPGGGEKRDDKKRQKKKREGGEFGEERRKDPSSRW